MAASAPGGAPGVTTGLFDCSSSSRPTSIALPLALKPGWRTRPQSLHTLCLSHFTAAPASERPLSACLLSASIFGSSYGPKFQFSAQTKQQAKGAYDSAPASKAAAEIGEEEEGTEISWIQEKGEDIAFYATSAVHAIPGPRVGGSGLPWLLALPLAYAAITFVMAAVKTIRKMNSPKEKRRRQIGKNAFLCESLSEFLPAKRLELTSERLRTLAEKCDFGPSEVVRKYIRFALNERPFNTDLVADLIHLKFVASIVDEDVPGILNEVSQRIVKSKGPVVMDTKGFTQRGLERKIAVQAIFSKLLYLSELEDFCPASVRDSLKIKEFFGVTDEDADSIRIDTLSEFSDADSLEKMVGGGEDELDDNKS